jgi:hypothetical protein
MVRLQCFHDYHCTTLCVSRRDSRGEPGLAYVVRLAVHLLDPARPESSAAFVGKLIIIFIKKVSCVCVGGRQG